VTKADTAHLHITRELIGGFFLQESRRKAKCVCVCVCVCVCLCMAVCMEVVVVGLWGYRGTRKQHEAHAPRVGVRAVAVFNVGTHANARSTATTAANMGVEVHGTSLLFRVRITLQRPACFGNRERRLQIS
jgi:hypothetical protein